MVIGNSVKQAGRRIAVAAAALVAVFFLAQGPAQARVDTGAAVGIGVGSFALGTAVGAAANPYGGYYGGYGYPYGGYYPAAPAYYPPPAPYYGPRNCWDPYYRRYYAC
jgi:hypothetical protein